MPAAIASTDTDLLDVVDNFQQQPSVNIERFYYSALQNSAAGVIIIGCGGEILHINQQAAEILRRPQAAVGEPFYSLFVDDKSFDRIVDVVFQGLSGPEGTHTGEVTFQNGHDFVHLDVKVSKFRDEAGALLGVVVVINDITHQHMRSASASIFASGVAVAFVYVSLMGLFSDLAQIPGARTLMNSLFMLLPAAGSIYVATQSALPIELLGLSWRNWKNNAREAVVLSLAFCAVLTLILFVLRILVPSLAHMPVVILSADTLAWPILPSMILYVLLTPLQEFLARGALQGPLEQVFTGRYRHLAANIMANLMFSVFHQHLGLSFAIMVLVPGFFWGWLFSRQKTLVGVSISHAIIGVYALSFINMKAFLDVLLAHH